MAASDGAGWLGMTQHLIWVMSIFYMPCLCPPYLILVPSMARHVGYMSCAAPRFSFPTKLDYKSIKCRFLGYEVENQYRLWDMKNKKVITLAHVRFDKQVANDEEEEDYDDTVYEARNGEDKAKWLKAFQAELNNMDTQKVWDLLPAPPGVKPIPGRWVLSHKLGPRGEIIFYPIGW